MSGHHLWKRKLKKSQYIHEIKYGGTKIAASAKTI